MKESAGNKNKRGLTVVFFATRFAFEYSVELANHIFRRKEVDRAILFLPGSFVSEDQLNQLDKDVEFHPFELPGNKRPLATFKSLSQVTRKIQKINPDVVHVQGSGHPYFWLNHRRIKKIPLVDTIHDAEPHPGFGNIFQTYMRRKAVKRARKWFIHGESLKKIYHNINPEIDIDDIVVIPKGHYGIFKKYSNEVLHEEENSILFFGNITRYKGIMVLIEASKKVIEAVPEVRFIIAGKIRSKDRESLDLSPIVNHPNFELMTYRLSDKEVSNVYQRSELLVLPYIEASQSGVLSIAFGMGKAVIASRVGALPEIIENGENGMLVEPGNAEELADAIIFLLKNTEFRKELGKNAMEYARRYLSWEEVAETTTKYYKEIVNKK